MILALSMFLGLLAAPTLEQDTDSELISPCPDVFMYELPTVEPNRWYGVINLTTDSTLYALWLDILLDDMVDILANWEGDVSTKDNKHFKIQNRHAVIEPGPPTPLRFFVQYSNTRPPRLQAIRLNGKEICTAAHSTTPIFRIGTTVKPVHKPTEPTRPDHVISRGSFLTNGTTLDRIIDASLKILRSPKSTNPRSIDGQPLCGKVVANHWPWQIALFQRKGAKSNYICGGTLVTARHVVTAAHCVTEGKYNSVVTDQHTLAVFLGIHNLWHSFDGIQVTYVKDIIIHPEYDASTYSHDVAILELRQPLTYTDWIRPACLWSQNEEDLENLIGKKGLVLSWGFDGNDEVISDLNIEEMPVVSQATCNKSSLKFVASEYVYCAGNINEKSPCAGAGSGMVFKIGSTWHLRGLTSLAAPGRNGKRCDSTYYIVFTDLAKLLPWMKSIVFDF